MPRSFFLTGQKIQTIQWQLHYMRILAIQRNASSKTVKLIRLHKKTLNDINSLIVSTNALSEDLAIDKILILSINICKNASNFLNEIAHKEKAYKRSMNSWKMQSRQMRLYEAGQHFAVLQAILDKLVHVQQCKANPETQEQLEKFTLELKCFEDKILRKVFLSLEKKYLLLDVQLLALKTILFFVVKC